MSAQKYNPEKGYIALLGWSLNAVEAADKFDRRYVVVAPDWAEAYCEEHDIPYVPWNFERLNDRCLLYRSPSPRDATLSRMPSSA